MSETDPSNNEFEKPTWRMFAGRDQHNGGFRNFGHPRYVQAYGHTEVVPVELVEDLEGPYWGWLRNGDTEPCMIQQHEGIFNMQFPYGPKAEEKAGRGRTVRLSAKELDETNND